MYDGASYRDTDWFQVVGTGGPLTASLRAVFNPQLIFIYNADCENLQYTLVSGVCVETLVLEHTVESGAIAWIWVGPSAFSGIGCGAPYVLELSGIAEEATPVAGKAWGNIKRLFR
ncbi:MAG: hypothetical protein KBD56_05385 [Candidatus Eisenbacteria bacterium]|nr:hypothetical protein [Candidatus Eisenbacteria bacterium]